MQHVLTLLEVLVLFGVTIFVHELGHFVVARLFGLQVDAFSIGFGPAVWKRKRNGVTYKIGAMPFGGYVALPQLEPGGGEDEEGKPRNLPRVAPWKKILVAAAGSAGNLLLAIAIAWVIYWVGKPSAPHETSSVVGYIGTNSAAYAAGIRVGDRILSVNGEQVDNWPEFRVLCALHGNVDLEVESPAGPRRVSLPTASGFAGVKEVEGLGPLEFCKVLATIGGSSAEVAGILPDDLIVEINGIKIYSIMHLIELVDGFRDRPVPVTVQRGDTPVRLTVTPAFDRKLGRALMGVRFNTYYVVSDKRVHPRPMEQIMTHAAPIFRILRALVTPREARNAARSLGGPPAIFWSLWIIVQGSVIMALWFTGFLNINLAILNLLPIPVLDGGHILFSLWEIVTRRPVRPKVIETLTYAFATLLIALMLFLSYRDVVNLFLPHREAVQAEQVDDTTQDADGDSGADD